jgi:hypothetical protein
MKQQHALTNTLRLCFDNVINYARRIRCDDLVIIL